jgi:hypothetical protein
VPVAEGVLQRWPVSKRVNSSKAPKDDETLTYIDAPASGRAASWLSKKKPFGPANFA